MRRRAARITITNCGAAFSSLDDADGNDWINYNGTFGSGFGGEYRGIPNLVLPNNGGQFHPGTKDNKLNTCLVSDGPAQGHHLLDLSQDEHGSLAGDLGSLPDIRQHDGTGRAI